MDSIGQAAEHIRILLDPMVAMIIRQVKPSDDDITISTAYNEYGRRWIDSHKERGNLKFRIKGKRRVLSRAQLESLRAAESIQPMLVRGAKINSKGERVATLSFIESKKQ